MAWLRQAPGHCSRAYVVQSAPDAFYSCKSKITLWMFVSPCSIPVGPGDLIPGMLAVGCRLMSPVCFLKQMCCHLVRLHLHPVACWIQTWSILHLAKVFSLGFEKNSKWLNFFRLSFSYYWFVGGWKSFLCLFFPLFCWLWAGCALGNYLQLQPNNSPCHSSLIFVGTVFWAISAKSMRSIVVI